MNTTVMDLTARGLLGRRRALALLALPAVLIVLALLFRILGEPDTATVVRIMNLGFGTVVPLLGVIVGTGAIGPEIEDGSILYLLSKPLSRTRIVLSKLIVAIAICCTLSAVPCWPRARCLAARATSSSVRRRCGARRSGLLRGLPPAGDRHP